MKALLLSRRKLIIFQLDTIMLFDALTYKINGCAMAIHNALGNGFQKVIYQRYLALELNKAGLHFGREVVAYNFPVGLLINFGSVRLQFTKIFNPTERR